MLFKISSLRAERGRDKFTRKSCPARASSRENPLKHLAVEGRLAVVVSYTRTRKKRAGSCRSAADRIVPSLSQSPTRKRGRKLVQGCRVGLSMNLQVDNI
jgi:hypothetical protein